MRSLADPIRALSGVGPEMARRLSRLGIATVRDLLFHVPTGYRDRRELRSIADLEPGADCTIQATVWDVRLERRQRGRRDLAATVRDETGTLRIVWFNQPHLERRLARGETYLFSGSAQPFRGLEIHNPEFEPVRREAPHLHVARVVPRYALTQGIAERWLRARVREALDHLPALADPVPEAWRRVRGLPSLAEALERVHFPEEPSAAEPARRRLALEELLRLHFSLRYARERHRGRRAAAPLAAGADAADRFVAALPFSLTDAQRRARAAIESDLDRPTPMRRLLLGDVGSGKTVLALAAMVRAAATGRQAALLAPTGILAEQHAATAERFLGAVGVPFALLTAATPPKERARLSAAFASGEIPLALGTHALLERDLEFRSLGLVVVDEQHRFGVRQRVTLAGKGSDSKDAHLLVLTATPIPRSLAMVLYGDLDVSILDEKPPGRARVTTQILSAGAPAGLAEILAEEVARAGSAFVVYPVVEEREALELKAATAMAMRLARDPRLEAAGVALLHGRLKPEERRAAVGRFRSGAARVLVATTVVEVGLDIPNATLVVIEHPERFGLAQLHQLRGRVGRADRAGRCILLAGPEIGELARRRLAIFSKLDDGLRLAEEDLRLRGPGEVLGTSQHGFPEFRAVDLLRDADLMEDARALAEELLSRGGADGGGERLRGWIETHFAGAERYLGSG
jgi:ATP-dependent DNA helicase RecG